MKAACCILRYIRITPSYQRHLQDASRKLLYDKDPGVMSIGVKIQLELLRVSTDLQHLSVTFKVTTNYKYNRKGKILSYNLICTVNNVSHQLINLYSKYWLICTVHLINLYSRYAWVGDTHINKYALCCIKGKKCQSNKRSVWIIWIFKNHLFK